MPDDTQIPGPIKELIRERIHSIEELEILLLSHREPSKGWSVPQLTSALKLLESSVEPAAESLLAKGFLELAGKEPYMYRYRLDPKLHELVEGLAETYENLRVETLVFIASSAINRVRKGALQTFSEAFRLKGKKDG